MTIRMILTTLSLLLTTIAMSQTYDRQYTVDFINGFTSEECEVFFEKKNLRIEYYAHGEAVRIDYIFPETIDYEEGVYYSTEENALVYSCYKKAGKQIEREIIKHGSKLLYDRSNIKVNCEGGDCDALVTASKHLIQLYLDKDFERTTPFEEN
mgnify:CR=1 FL=1|jgi:hypothetical protein